MSGDRRRVSPSFRDAVLVGVALPLFPMSRELRVFSLPVFWHLSWNGPPFLPGKFIRVDACTCRNR